MRDHDAAPAPPRRRRRVGARPMRGATC